MIVTDFKGYELVKDYNNELKEIGIGKDHRGNGFFFLQNNENEIDHRPSFGTTQLIAYVATDTLSRSPLRYDTDEIKRFRYKAIS